jgi:LysR family transcriptional regulator, nitrogen assimilation regulatory protein
MNVSTVQLFLEVAEAGSLSKVAARRQTVQSHISRQISDFEKQCGGRLFSRTGRGVELTELGTHAASRLRTWLQDTEQIAQELRSLATQLGGTVRVGIIPTAAHPLMTRVFEWLQVEHPAVKLDITEAQGAELDALLDSGLVDLAILFRFHLPSGNEEKRLCMANTYLVSAPGNILTREPTIPFSRLSGLRLVLPRRPSRWRNALDETARGLGFGLQPVVEADSLTLQKELVAGSQGLYSVLGPYAFAEELRNGRLQATRLIRPDLVRHVTLAFRTRGKMLPTVRVVAERIQHLVRSWDDQLMEP